MIDALDSERSTRGPRGEIQKGRGCCLTRLINRPGATEPQGGKQGAWCANCCFRKIHEHSKEQGARCVCRVICFFVPRRCVRCTLVSHQPVRKNYAFCEGIHNIMEDSLVKLAQIINLKEKRQNHLATRNQQHGASICVNLTSYPTNQSKKQNKNEIPATNQTLFYGLCAGIRSSQHNGGILR